VVDVASICAHGWRQGAVFREQDQPRLAELISVDIEQGAHLLVVSQDCDIVHHNSEAEPIVEVLLAEPLQDKPSGSFTYGKNPRRLQIPIIVDGSSQYFECAAKHRYFINRQVLADCPPDSRIQVEDATLQLIRSWLAARYTRTAFPDAFNLRIAGALSSQARMLKSRGSDLSGIYIAVTPWDELNEGESYRVELYATMEIDAWENTDARQEMASLVDDLALAINHCEGIDVENHEIRSEEDISLADIRVLRRWDYDYLSYRESPEGVLPAQ